MRLSFWGFLGVIAPTLAILFLPSTSTAQTFDEWMDSGQVYLDSYRIPQAIASFEAALEIDSTSAEAFCQLGTAKFIINPREGLVEFEKAIELDSTYERAYARASEVYAYRREFEKSHAYCEKAYSLAPNYWNCVRWARKNETTNPELALQLYTEATTRDYNDAGNAYVERAYLLASLERFTEAAEDLHQALVLIPIDEFPWEWFIAFGEIFHDAGDSDSGCAMWQMALLREDANIKPHQREYILNRCP